MRKLLRMIPFFLFVLGIVAISLGNKNRNNLHLISLDDDIMDAFIANNKIDGKYDVYAKAVITHDQYDFIKEGVEIKTIGVSATYIVSNKVSTDDAYLITKQIWESKGSIGHSIESTMNINNAFVTIGNCKLHPGAVRYYEETGLTVDNKYIDSNFIEPESKVKSINVYTGGTGGTYYAFSNGLGTILNTKLKSSGLSFSIVGDTGGSVANLNAIKKGSCDMAIVQNDTMVNAYNGLTKNFTNNEVTNFYVIGEVYQEVVQIVCNDKRVNKLSDLIGSNLSISIGDVGSGVADNAVALLKAYNVDIQTKNNKIYVSNDVTINNLSVALSADAMKDETVDLFFFTSGAPATSITELSTSLS